ncbi:TPA: DUF1642 domain-containing protein [Streptococcus suis]
MNINEAIKKVEQMGEHEHFVDEPISKKSVLNILNQINTQPKPVIVPKFIADKIEYCKNTEGYGLFHAMDYCYQYKDSADWLECNEETFAQAWIFGYEVEKEQLYVVTDGNKLYLKEFDELNAIIIIDDVVGVVDDAKRYEDKNQSSTSC